MIYFVHFNCPMRAGNEAKPRMKCKEGYLLCEICRQARKWTNKKLIGCKIRAVRQHKVKNVDYNILITY